MKNKNPKERYHLPGEVKFCKKCVVSNQRPRIVFDEEGVCSACRYWERKATSIDWAEREHELNDLLNRHRRKDGHYDVIVPSSGGKDSSVVAHKLKYQYAMTPLTVTWAPHAYTDIGRQNFYGLIDGGLDNILGTPNSQVHRLLTKISFEELGEPFQPFVYGQTNFPLQIAVAYNIPLVFFGENGDAEYGGDPTSENEAYYEYESKIVEDYYSSLPPEKMEAFGIQRKDLVKYLPPAIETMKKMGLQCHFWSYYKNWQPQQHYYYAAEHTHFRANPEGRSEGTYSKYASLDDKIDGFHFYLSLIKFGIARATSDAAHEIREGLITREEGIALVKRYDTEFPGKLFNYFLDYCRITEDHFWEVIESWRSEHIWKSENGIWKLRHPIWEEEQETAQTARG